MLAMGRYVLIALACLGAFSLAVKVTFILSTELRCAFVSAPIYREPLSSFAKNLLKPTFFGVEAFENPRLASW